MPAAAAALSVAPDFALPAILPQAMNAGFDLDVPFPVDRLLLEGLEHFQEVWHRWRPDVFAHRVRIHAEAVDRRQQRRETPERAVAAFSAGVDSSFTLLRHAGGPDWPGRRALASAVMVHGFDMPLAATEGFARLQGHGAAIARDLGVDFFVMRTNWRETAPNWQMSFGAGLAAVLHQFSGRHGIGLVASEESYENAFTVWGNSFWNGRFFSRGDFRIESDGGAYDRIDRIAALAARPAILENLSVCWAGPRTGENCGTCPKCVLTKLNFKIAGIERPWPFPQPLSAGQVSAMPIKTAWQARFLAIIEGRLAAGADTDADLLHAVRERIARSAAEDGYGAAFSLAPRPAGKPPWKRAGQRLLRRARRLIRS
ncbi:hypothetical protein LXM94_04115 [Rhizobium sp. TRM95111]|uniref:hypothetical protein n=1 Tax=Rhizobium alarense TaxID=2846851 RepID=UPI001F33DFF7|nr:hypothetical protein [Rhizobium alarense]MCF3639146.1 hypothetical protein [Rhizobium alarense]